MRVFVRSPPTVYNAILDRSFHHPQKFSVVALEYSGDIGRLFVLDTHAGHYHGRVMETNLRRFCRILDLVIQVRNHRACK